MRWSCSPQSSQITFMRWAADPHDSLQMGQARVEDIPRRDYAPQTSRTLHPDRIALRRTTSIPLSREIAYLCKPPSRLHRQSRDQRRPSIKQDPFHKPVSLTPWQLPSEHRHRKRVRPPLARHISATLHKPQFAVSSPRLVIAACYSSLAGSPAITIANLHIVQCQHGLEFLRLSYSSFVQSFQDVIRWDFRHGQ